MHRYFLVGEPLVSFSRIPAQTPRKEAEVMEAEAVIDAPRQGAPNREPPHDRHKENSSDRLHTLSVQEDSSAE